MCLHKGYSKIFSVDRVLKCLKKNFYWVKKKIWVRDLSLMSECSLQCIVNHCSKIYLIIIEYTFHTPLSRVVIKQKMNSETIGEKEWFILVQLDLMEIHNRFENVN